MEKREEYRDIELGGKKWRIGRFDALTGSYITTKILMQALPFIDEQVTGGVLSSKRSSSMSKTDFFEIQTDCLKVCSQLQMVGAIETPVPVMLPDGRWGVGDGINTDMTTVIGLTAHVLIFNITDFFQGNTLNDLMAGFKGLSLFSVKE